MTLLIASSCSKRDLDTSTLYRESVVEDRVHIATFDTSYGEEHNARTCEITRDLFQSQPDILVKFWCEKGTFRK